MKFWLCIDDTDDKTKNIGTGTIAGDIYDRLVEQGCRMKYRITRHQLLLDPAIAYTSHNSSMCMEGESELQADAIWEIALQMLLAHRSPISHPGICLYVRSDSAREDELIRFGWRAKREVLHLQDALELASRIPGLRLEAPAGNGNGQIGALAGVGLRLDGNDGTFRGKIVFEEPIQESAADMKARLGVTYILDAKNNRILADDEIVRVVKQAKLIYRDHQPMAGVRLMEDGIYEICSKASIYEDTITVRDGSVENCEHFQWDNDRGEMWSDKAGSCENCLHRRLTRHGMKCTREDSGKGQDHGVGRGMDTGGGKGNGTGGGHGQREKSGKREKEN